MILIGQYDSPFVRRTAITMNFHGIGYQRKILSVFSDFEQMLEHNPLGKVPALQLDNGEYLFDSRMIIDYLERQVAAPQRLVPEDGPQRIAMQRIEAVALGLAEKSYERGIEYARRQPDKVDDSWAERLRRQILSALGWLQARQPDPWFCGDKISLADITCAVAFTYLREKQQIRLARGDFPVLDRHCDACEQRPEFAAAAYSAEEASRSGWKPRQP